MDRLIVVNRSRRSEWCTTCARPVEMLSVDDAALLTHVNSTTIFRSALAGDLHSRQRRDGGLLICCLSLTLFLRCLFCLADPNGLDVDELADAEFRELATVTGMLHTAKRQARI